VPEEDLAVLPRRLREAAQQEPNAETMWPPEYVPDVLRALARAGRTVVRLVLVTSVGETGEVGLHDLSEGTWGQDGTALDMHLAAQARPDLPPHDRVMVVW
jgi:hypothetical protein